MTELRERAKQVSMASSSTVVSVATRLAVFFLSKARFPQFCDFWTSKLRFYGVHVHCVMLQRSALATRLAVAVVDRAPLRCLERARRNVVG